MNPRPAARRHSLPSPRFRARAAGRAPWPAPFRAAGSLALALALAGCATQLPQRESAAPPPAAAPAPSEPAAPLSAPSTPGPDARGVVAYSDYAAVVARQGDDVDAMAARVGVPAAELAAYNGLPVGYRPEAGEEFVLPPRPEGYAAAAAPAPAAPSDAPSAFETAALPAPGDAASGPSALSTAPADPAAPPADPFRDAPPTVAEPLALEPGSGVWSPALIEDALAEPAAAPRPTGLVDADGVYREVAYHDVGPEETIYSIARRYAVPAETLIAWNALSGPSYTVTPGQVLTIPEGGRAPDDAPATALSAPGNAGDALPPSAAAAPLPPDRRRPEPLASPQLDRFQSAPPTPPATATAPAAASRSEAAAAPPPAPSVAPAAAPADDGRLLRPVPGRIVQPYSKAPGPTKNDGVDFAAEAGEPVRAARAGDVALVSTSLGEWGTIVLLRHADGLITVYARLGEARVAKGQAVEAGEVVGTVAAPESGRPRLHFEVRRGAFSEDPEPYL